MENKTRKLVTIRKISKVINHPNADRLDICQIDGWQVITKRDEFKEGSSCIFFEIDSFLPVEDRYSFLGKPKIYQGKEGYRIRTQKFRNELSQGLALPLSMFPEITNLQLEDYTDILNVTKYDVAVQTFDQRPGLKAGKSRGSFPSFIPKTDQERIQNLTHLFTTHQDHEFEETLKLDGSSMTCYKIHKPLSFLAKVLSWFGKSQPTHHFGVCSRNLELSREANQVTTFLNQGKSSEYNQSDFWRTAIKLDIENKLPKGYAVQGELIGPKIQANHEKVTTLDYFIFDVFDIEAEMYLLPEERQEFCKQHNLQHIPVTNKNFKPCSLSLEELLKHVDTESMNPNTVSEGRVYKSLTSQLSFKVINNRYLLKCEN